MRERLREVAEEPARFRVVLLREQSDVVAEAEQAFQQRKRVLAFAGEHERLDHPEAARQEDAFRLAAAVDSRIGGVVALPDAAVRALPPQDVDRRTRTRIVTGQD